MRHSFQILLFYSGVALLGIISLFRLEISYYPEITVPYAYVVTDLSGMSADQVEELITVPLESSLSSIKNIRKITSESKRGSSIIKLEFSWNADMNVTGSDIRNRIDSVYPFLPESASHPVLSFRTLSDSKAMTLVVFPKENLSVSQISHVVEKEFKSRLMAVEGVAQVELSGCVEPEIHIDVDYPFLISSTALNLDDVADIVGRSIFRYPAGTVEEKGRQYLIKAETGIRSAEDISRIPLDSEGALTVGDIAEVSEGEKIRTSCFHYNGQEGIGIQIIKTGGSSLLHICREITLLIPHLSKLYDPLFDICIVEDTSRPLVQAVRSLVFSILLGILCASAAIAFFMHQKYLALIVILTLPFSLMPLFVIMHCTGMTLNIITLSALAVGSGMVFDSSIVVTQHLMAGKRPFYSAPAVIGSTLTTIIIFLPILMLPGIMGKVFSSLAVTVILFLAISCIVSLTLVPALFDLVNYLIRQQDTSFCIEKWYKAFSDFASHRRKLAVPLALISIIPLALIFVIPKAILPENESAEFEIQVDFPPSYPFELYNSWALELEQDIIRRKLCDSIALSGGKDSLSVEQDANRFIFWIKGKNKKEILDRFDSSIWNCEVRPGKDFLSALVGSSDMYVITAPDRETLEQKRRAVVRKAEQDGILVNARKGFEVCPEYRFYVTDSIYSLGITPADIFKNIALGTDGQVVAQIETAGSPVDVRLRYGRSFVDSADKAASLLYKEKDNVIFTRSFIEVNETESSGNLCRLDRQNALFFSLSKPPPESYGTICLADSILKSNMKNVLLLFAGALVFVWFVLAIQFESLLIPFVILGTVPLGMAGSFLALYLAGKSLNISSFLGIMILTGTAVNSGILIRSEIELGCSVQSAACSRLRTVFLSVLSTAMALFPVALLDTNPIQNCASISLLGGLLLGTAALFALIPFFSKEAHYEHS